MKHDASRQSPNSSVQAESKAADRAPRLAAFLLRTTRHLRSAAASFCLVLCVGLLLSWLLTYYAKFELFNNVERFELYCVESWKGKLQLSYSNNMGKTDQIGEWVWWTIADKRLYSDYAQHAKEWEATTFGIAWTKDDKSFAVPHWLVIVLAALLSAILKPTPRLKYGFHDLLLLTTVAAILAGCLAIVAKNLS